MAANTIIFWLILMVDWITYIVIFFLGILLALISYYLTTDTPLNFEIYKGTIAELIGSFIVVAFFASNKFRLEREKLQTMKALGASLAHELRTPLGAIASGVVGLKNYIPELLTGFKVAQTNKLITSDIEDDQLEMVPIVLDSINDESESCKYDSGIIADKY